MFFTSNHGADGVEAGVETHHFSLDAFGVGVVHGVLERGLAVAVFVRRASRELGFVRPPESTERAITEKWGERKADFPSNPRRRSYHTHKYSFVRNSFRSAVLRMWGP